MLAGAFDARLMPLAGWRRFLNTQPWFVRQMTRRYTQNSSVRVETRNRMECSLTMLNGS